MTYTLKNMACDFGLHSWKFVKGRADGYRFDWFKCKRRGCMAEKCE